MMKIQYVDHSASKTDSNATYILDKCRVSVLNQGLLRVEYGDFVDQCTQTIWYRKAKANAFTFAEEKNRIIVTFPDKKVVIDVNGIDKSYVIIDGKRVPLDNTHNLKGTTRTLDMSPEDYIHYDDPIALQRRDIYYTDDKILDNGVCSSNGVAIFDDRSLVIDEDGTVLPNPLLHDYYVFIHKNDYYGAISDLYDITGKIPMLPKYAFGNWWSRYWAYSDKEYLALIDTFRKKNIPLSVATVDMDWHYVDLQKEFGVLPQGQLDEEKYGEWHGWTGWTWNKHLFQNYRAFLAALKQRNLHTTLNLHPSSGFRWFEDCYKSVCVKLGIDPDSKKVVPFDFTDNDFIQAYLDVLHDYEKEGVDFWWIDWQQGNSSKIEGFDPLWGLNHFQYYDSQNSGKRGLILSRYAGVGSHRYPLGFSGDTTQKWSLLEYVINFTALSANIGYTFWSHDIGGHHSGFKDEQLYVRWLQFALFNPILRLHSASGMLYGKEPWNYDKETELLATDLLQRRQRFIPYLYTQACANHFDNIPFIRPLYYDFPKDKMTYKANCQYMLGDLLICPITKRTDSKSRLASRKVYFPEGSWTDIYTNTKYVGGKHYTIYRTLGEIPVFVKDGGIIYRNGNMDNCASSNPVKLQLKLFLGSGCCTIYEDDGETLEYIDGKYLRTTVKQSMEDGLLQLELSFEGDNSVVPKVREFEIECPNSFVSNVTIENGTVLNVMNYSDTASFSVGNITSDNKVTIKANIVAISKKDYIARQLQRILLQTNGVNQRNLNFYDLLLNSDIDKLVEIISSSDYLPAIKGRLLEVLKGLNL